MVAQTLHENRQPLNGKGERAQNGSGLRAMLFFLAAAEAVHTLVHVWIAISGVLPASDLWFHSFTITHEVNLLAIVVNGIIVVGFLDAAIRLKK